MRGRKLRSVYWQCTLKKRFKTSGGVKQRLLLLKKLHSKSSSCGLSEIGLLSVYVMAFYGNGSV
jgi:hypothetical protein